MLANNGSDVPVTIVGGGSHTIAVPVTLANNMAFSGDAGSQPGGDAERQRARDAEGRRIGRNYGTLTLAGAENDAVGGMIVNSGTLAAAGNVGLTNGLTVNGGAMIATGNLSAASVTVTGRHHDDERPDHNRVRRPADRAGRQRYGQYHERRGGRERC